MKLDIPTMEKSKILLTLKNIFHEVLGQDFMEDIKKNYDLKIDLGLDSFSAIEALVLVEKRFFIKINLSYLPSLKTINDVVNLIIKLKNEQS